jgi:hypothetical protein
MDLGTLAVSLGSFPLDDGPYHPPSHCLATLTGIRSLIGFGNLGGPLAHSVLYLRRRYTRRCTSIHFGENQLSPGLISLSLLPTGHLQDFQLL